ncbi:MAG: guanylate kinase [Candidatus Cloacimonetes bacterium]|nr:guanylate kinase [Candidatus Cloacimonadota bacterium]
MINQNNNFLIILSAPSGGGKSTILNEVLKLRDNIDYSISYTTRAPRGAEQNGVHYHFVDEVAFLAKLEAQDFLEHAKVFDKYWYGTSLSYTRSRLEKSRHVIMDIDVQGAAQIAATGKVPCVRIFILPPNMEELKKRLIHRGTDSEEDIASRLATARKELDRIPEYDYLVINDDLEQAVADVLAIIRAEELKVSGYQQPKQEFLQ